MNLIVNNFEQKQFGYIYLFRPHTHTQTNIFETKENQKRKVKSSPAVGFLSPSPLTIVRVTIPLVCY